MIFPILRKLVSQTQQARTKTILVMKWTAIFLLAGCLQVAASGNAQHIQLKFSNAALKTVFKDISRQTGYSFFYNAKLLQGMEKVDVDLKNATLKEALEAALKDLPLTFSIVNTTIVVKPKPASGVAVTMEDAEILVVGKVLDETGKPLEGASISVKGSDKGTSSAFDGGFSVTVEKGAEIVVTYLGYEPFRFTARKEGVQVIRMKLSQQKDTMQNVVVTGYQNIRKDNFTGTAVTVSGEDLKMVNPQNMLRSLQVFDPSFRIVENNILGSNPNRLPNITVRGSTALPTGNSTELISRDNLSGNMNLPAFILDGYEVSLQKIYDLDINRVQSITLLKDAAATAIYGSRAANGVVVITTKAPKPGKLQVSYNYELNVTTPDLTPYEVLDAKQKLQYEQAAQLYDADANQAMSQDQLDELFYHKMKLVVGGVNTYWLSQPVRTAFGNKHSLFLEGGENAIRYGLELRYQTMPGVMQGSTRDRLSTGLHFTYSPSSKFLFRNVITVTQMKASESPFGNFSDYVRMNPYYPKTDSTGRIIQVIDSWTDRSRGNGVETYPVLNPMYNSTLGSFNKSDYLEVIDAITAEWNITRGLRLRGLMSVNKTKTTGNNFVSPFSNEFYDYGADRLDERGRYEYNINEETRFDGNITLNYNKMMGGHFLNAMLGSNLQSYLSEYKAITAAGFTNDRFRDIGFASGYAAKSTPYSNVNEERLVGAFLSVNYSYDNKYLMDLTFRQDGSSKFGKEKRFAPFGAVGIGWNLHREEFMKDMPFSRFKVRASTGVTGSVSFSPYMSQTTYSYYTGNWYSTGIGAIVNNFGNAELQWQRTKNYDLGLEIGLLNDRIVISPRYYYKLTKGLLADIFLPPSTGFGSYKDNVGDMENVGAEINIQANVLRTKNWNLNLMGNFVRNKNTIVRISNALKAYNDKVEDEQDNPEFKGVPLLRYEEGRSLDAWYAVRSLGIDPENGREMYMKRDGTLTYDWDARDITVVGNKAPKGEGFFGANARFKQFNLNLNFYTRFGGEQYNQTLVDRVENANPRWNVDARVFEEKWKQRGDRTFYKNIADLGNTDVSSRFIQKDNVIELQSLYLSYDVADVRRFKIGMQSLRFAFTMNDIWRTSSIKQERGIDYPYARSLTFSLQAGF